MKAARALADLVEISPEIEAAAVVAADGEVTGSVGVTEARSSLLARAVRELVDGVSFRSEGRVTQLHAELAGGDVFTVTGAAERTVVAVTGKGASPGLLFYDLKRCLAAVDDET